MIPKYFDFLALPRINFQIFLLLIIINSRILCVIDFLLRFQVDLGTMFEEKSGQTKK